jgi:hypothetical protein
MAVEKVYFDPVAGQEQPVSITTEESTAWTEVDVSAAFSASYGTKAEILALVALGHDHDENSTEAFAEMRFRMDARSWEDVRGVSGFGNFIYIEGTDYASGGFASVVTIPLTPAGKFEYWVKNHAYPPRSIVRILKCGIDLDVASSVTLLPKDAIVDSASEDFPRLNIIQGANTDADYVLEFDHDASQKAHWSAFQGGVGSEFVHVYIVWTTQGGVAGNKVRWDVSLVGRGDDAAWDAALTT